MQPDSAPKVIHQQEPWGSKENREKIRQFLVPLFQDSEINFVQTVKKLSQFVRDNKIASNEIEVDVYSSEMFKWMFSMAYYNKRFSTVWGPALGDAFREIIQQQMKGQSNDNILKLWLEKSKAEDPSAYEIIEQKAQEILDARQEQEVATRRNDESEYLVAKEKADKLSHSFPEYVVRKYPFTSLMYFYNNGDLKYLWGVDDKMTVGGFEGNQEFTHTQTVGENWDTWNNWKK